MSSEPAPAYQEWCEACRATTWHAYYQTGARARCMKCWERFWAGWLSLTDLERARLKFVRWRYTTGHIKGGRARYHATLR